MDDFEKRINHLLTDTYKNVVKVEENMLKSTQSPLSISEIHLLEAVGNAEGHTQTVSALAETLDITTSSVTIAVGKLVRRGYLLKDKSLLDGRSVCITLTREGEKIHRLHRYFHMKMVRSLVENFDEGERRALLSGLEKLDKFFLEKVSETEA